MLHLELEQWTVVYPGISSLCTGKLLVGRLEDITARNQSLSSLKPGV